MAVALLAVLIVTPFSLITSTVFGILTSSTHQRVDLVLHQFTVQVMVHCAVDFSSLFGILVFMQLILVSVYLNSSLSSITHP